MEEMSRILVKKRIPVIVADRAILKTLPAAVDLQLADLRYRQLKTLEAHRHDALDRLIRGLRQLSEAIARLPPTSRGELNKRVLPKVGQSPFDSEVFIEVIMELVVALPGISPRQLADNVLSLIHPERDGGMRPAIFDQWEAMPATMRLKVERMVQTIPSRSLVDWPRRVADLLDRERPARKRACSTVRAFVSRVAAVGHTIRLTPGRAYDCLQGPGERHVESSFQRYCRAALKAFGDTRRISARQIVNYKKSKRAIRR
jgi:hypothetical protein